jgi:hypothetical protein
MAIAQPEILAMFSEKDELHGVKLRRLCGAAESAAMTLAGSEKLP